METAVERGRRLGRKYVTVLVGIFAGAVTLVSTQQLVAGVFGLGASPIDGTHPGVAAGGCAEELRAMSSAVERAIAASSEAPDEARASEQYRAALSPEWNDSPTVESRCAGQAHGSDALATVVRLRMAGEQLARRHSSELAPLRRDVAAFLPP
jgi:hypothetical protein